MTDQRGLVPPEDSKSATGLPPSFTTSRLSLIDDRKLAEALAGGCRAEIIHDLVERCMSVFYDPHRDDERKRKQRLRIFVDQLTAKPEWAVIEAFRRIFARSKNFPTPGEVRSAVQTVLEPIGREMGARRKERDRRNAEQSERINTVDEEARERILAEFGFQEGFSARINRFPMADSRDALVDREERILGNSEKALEGLTDEQKDAWRAKRRQGFV